MKKSVFFSLLMAFTVAGIIAQDCPLYYPDAVNSQLEYKQYDKKGKLSGSSIQKITDFRKTGDGYEVRVSAESFDAKGKSLGSIDLAARCEGGIFYIDMKNLVGSQSLESFKDMEMKVEGGNMELPASMKTGDVLKNGDMKISISSGGMAIMNMSFSVTNRKVEAVETITTPGGSFECYKISYDVATRTIVNVKTKGIDWYAKGTGLIKSESYSNDGKLMGSSVLESIK